MSAERGAVVFSCVRHSHLADELAAKGVDDAGNGGGGALADEVKVQHALDGTRLQTVDEASCLVVEEVAEVAGAQRARGSSEAGDVVVCVCACARHGWSLRAVDEGGEMI